MKSWGADGTASYTHRFGNVDVELRGNFTLTRDKIIDYDEVPPATLIWLKRNQLWCDPWFNRSGALQR